MRYPGLYIGDSFAEVYKPLLSDLVYKPDYVVSPRDLKVHELDNVRIEIMHPLESLFTNDIRSSKLSYIAAEFLWYLCRSRSSSFISRHAKLWDYIKNSDGSVNSAYGHLIFENFDDKPSQWSWAYESLLKDKDSRQAIMHFNRPAHQFDGNKDFVCTMYATFHIRNEMLNMTVVMRSNDAIKGLPTDIPFFTFLQHQMVLQLIESGKYSNLRIGKYVHIVNSMHLYDADMKTTMSMLDKRFESVRFPESTVPVIDYTGKVHEYYHDLYKLFDSEIPVYTLPTTEDILYNFIVTHFKQK